MDPLTFDRYTFFFAFKVEERFQLNLTDDEAIKFFQNLINESVSAMIPQIAEAIHGWTQHWRK